MNIYIYIYIYNVKEYHPLVNDDEKEYNKLCKNPIDAKTVNQELSIMPAGLTSILMLKFSEHEFQQKNKDTIFIE